MSNLVRLLLISFTLFSASAFSVEESSKSTESEAVDTIYFCETEATGTLPETTVNLIEAKVTKYKMEKKVLAKFNYREYRGQVYSVCRYNVKEHKNELSGEFIYHCRCGWATNFGEEYDTSWWTILTVLDKKRATRNRLPMHQIPSSAPKCDVELEAYTFCL